MSEKTSKPISGHSEHGTDWDALANLTDEEIEAAIAGDPDAARPLPREWFERAEQVQPGSKRPISIRLDREVLNFFMRTGKGYQSRINKVLRTYVRFKEAEIAEQQKEKARR